MDAETEILHTRISRLLGWERRKRRERNLTTALFYAFLAALGAPLFVSISHGWAWAAPAVIFAVLAPWLLFARRWRGRDTARALAALDRALHLDERATTAWEFVRRNERKAVALLVLREASERLKSVDARALFPRSWGWHGYLLAPLVALWLALYVFEARFQPQDAGPGRPPALSQELREFAHRLQEKAQSGGLPQALEAGRELEKIAQRGIDSGMTDDQFRSELAGTGRKMAAARDAAGHEPTGVAESRQQLEDLAAELEAARELLDAPDGEGRSLEDRLAGLRQLKQQLERQEDGARMLSRDEMKAFLDKLERRVAGELDRRALREAERFVQQLAQRGEGKQGNAEARAGSSKEQSAAGEGRRDKNAGAAPGEGPAANSGEAPAPPEFRAGAGARAQGMIGEGERSSIFFRARPAPGKSKLSQDEVVASYRRQAEAELGTESIPAELKDTIRNYFLSLEKAQ